MFTGVLTGSRLPQPEALLRTVPSAQRGDMFHFLLSRSQTSRFLTLTSRLRSQKSSMFAGVLTGSRLLHPRQALSSFGDRALHDPRIWTAVDLGSKRKIHNLDGE